MSTPHDALFKAVYGEVEHARGTLRALVPTMLARTLDWESLHLEPGNFVDPELVERFTDLLYTARWRDGGEVLVYLLFEHQSSPDLHMPFRLLRYLVRIWERWLAEHENAVSLPIIIPVVQYHDAKAWPAPLAFSDLFEIPEHVRNELAPYLVEFRYILDDLTRVPDAVLGARAMTALGALTSLCFKYVRTHHDPLALLASWGILLRAIDEKPRGREMLSRIARYILLVSHVDRSALSDLFERLLGRQAKDTIMTTGEQLIQQGMEQGLQQGMQQGRQQGMQQGASSVVLALLQCRFGQAVTPQIEQRVSAASPADLEALAKRLLSAGSLEELVPL